MVAAKQVNHFVQERLDELQQQLGNIFDYRLEEGDFGRHPIIWISKTNSSAYDETRVKLQFNYSSVRNSIHSQIINRCKDYLNSGIDDDLEIKVD